MKVCVGGMDDPGRVVLSEGQPAVEVDHERGEVILSIYESTAAIYVVLPVQDLDYLRDRLGELA